MSAFMYMHVTKYYLPFALEKPLTSIFSLIQRCDSLTEKREHRGVFKGIGTNLIVQRQRTDRNSIPTVYQRVGDLALL